MGGQKENDQIFIDHGMLAINVARLEEQQKFSEHRQAVLERTLEHHLESQNATNERLYEIAYSSFNQIKQAKYWISGAIFGVGLVWVLVTNLDNIKAFLS